MPVENSFGAVVYRDSGQAHKFLLLFYGNGYWDYPKGHPEKGEGGEQAMLRELREETGLDDVEVRGELGTVKYFFKKEGKTVMKFVKFFLVKTGKAEIKLSFEHKDYRWVSYEEGMELLKFKTSKEMLEKAEGKLG